MLQWSKIKTKTKKKSSMLIIHNLHNLIFHSNFSSIYIFETNNSLCVLDGLSFGFFLHSIPLNEKTLIKKQKTTKNDDEKCEHFFFSLSLVITQSIKATKNRIVPIIMDNNNSKANLDTSRNRIKTTTKKSKEIVHHHQCYQ